MRSSQLPGPTPMPVVGNLPAVIRGVLGFLDDNAYRYGDRVYWTAPGDRVLQLTHPDDIEFLLLRARDQVQKDPVTHSLEFILGHGLLTAEGEVWKRHRKLAAPSFTPAHLAAYGRDMVRSALEDLPEAGPIDVHQWMTRVTLHIVLRTLFGQEPGGIAHDVGPLTEQLMTAFDVEYHGPARLLPEWVPLPHRNRLTAGARELDTLLRRLVAERREREPGDDLLSRLIEARTEDGQALTDTEVRDDALTLFMAGHETTALSLSYTLWLLGLDPVLQERVVAELEQVLGEADATPADLRRLPLTCAAIDESMRLYPPAWTIGRQALQDIELDGLTIEQGTHILLPQWVVHRDPRWWRAPLSYRPDRWLDGETEGLPRFAYYPFGGGARVCIGNHFARMEAVLVLATVLRRFRVESRPGWQPELLPSVTLRPEGGIPLVLAPRGAATAPRRQVA